MQLMQLLSADRVAIRHNVSASPLDKTSALHALAKLLALGTPIDPDLVEKVLVEREQLQSTGIGEGVAIPHGAMSQLDAQHATLLIVPEGVDFAAIDGLAVNILFAVVGPKRATGEHLKTLARVSRVLRNKSFRDRLVAAPSSEAAYELIAAEDGDPR
jgi:PTS system nitrogen regulatory IIA component